MIQSNWHSLVEYVPIHSICRINIKSIGKRSLKKLRQDLKKGHHDLIHEMALKGGNVRHIKLVTWKLKYILHLVLNDAFIN